MSLALRLLTLAALVALHAHAAAVGVTQCPNACICLSQTEVSAIILITQSLSRV